MDPMNRSSWQRSIEFPATFGSSELFSATTLHIEHWEPKVHFMSGVQMFGAAECINGSMMDP